MPTPQWQLSPFATGLGSSLLFFSIVFWVKTRAARHKRADFHF
jgi:hypothetical protein